MTFEEHQAETARQLGYGDDVAAMNADHDPLHRALCAWLGVESQALRAAAGERLTKEEQDRAAFEEAAVLAVQKFMRLCGAAVPHQP